MNNNELKNEAEVYYSKLSKTEPITIYDYHLSVIACYLAGVEPREKQIQIDAEQIRALQKQNGELTDKCNKLEAQIEKMKCCDNCRYCNEWGEANSNSPNCKKCNWISNWKIRR